MIIKIYGASDDLIEVEGCEGADEFYTYEVGPVMWRGDLIAPNGDTMRVLALDGWDVAFGKVDEDIPFPSWPVTLRQHPEISYSVLAEIDAPDGTRLENIWPVRKDGGDGDG